MTPPVAPTPVKPVPVMVTEVPVAAGPLPGLTAVTDGAPIIQVSESQEPPAPPPANKTSWLVAAS